GTVSDAELAAADLVVEAIYENAEAKRELYARLEKKLPAHAILCSNTSTIPISELAGGLARPEQFCGLHFFNPVRMMPLVEVIRGRATSDDTIATAFGMPMGPITLYDTVGLDVALHAGGVMRAAFPDRVVPSAILPAMVEAGRIGKKRIGGFFNYSGKRNDNGSDSPEAAAVIDAHRRGEKKFSPEELTDRLLLPMLLEATRLLEDGVAQSVRDVDLALIYGIGFPPFRGGLFFWADTLGAKAIVERLKAYESLGERFKPTKMLLEHAKSGKKFYDV
ncbi:MAG TPA: 3-hydroxyacyl-CoA dehydrogenase NAD-binding domain-containing protein, partial [Planctomycetia bacterium]|nr:3-hydroxyacyl-CoA dehydrogenase NAD-binding domain-containing protein [Planctomycetia bacterium]